jgi:phage terminase small subunit
VAVKKRRKKARPKPKPKPKVLTERQKAFAREYLVDYNGQAAAIRVGYSPRSAKVTASRMLTQANVQKELARRAVPVQKAAELKAAEVLQLAMLVANGDIRTLFTADDKGQTTIKDMRELTVVEQRLVVAWKRKSEGIEIRFADRDKAVERLMKHYGLLKEHVQLETTSELTPQEQERIASFTDEELAEFNAANDVIHRLLYPDQAQQGAA